MTVSLVYETHSLTEDNATGHATGWLPGKLSEQGRLLAAELGERRRNDGIDMVFSSDLARAAETAEVAFGGSGILVLHDWRLRECNYGELNGMPVAKLREVHSKHVDIPYPGGQSYRDVVDVTRSFLSDLLTFFDGKRVCVIAHAANKRALDVLLLGANLEDAVRADLGWREGWEYTLDWPK
jgi:broad specificity phosphatase PhoE